MDTSQGMKMKILCLHGFRTSGNSLKKQISRWDPSIFANFDMVTFFFPLFYLLGKEKRVHILLVRHITNNGPFDCLLGFSQGAALAGLLLGYKAQGNILKYNPEFKLLISISGSKFREPTICKVAYAEPIMVKSVHLIGEKDWLKLPTEELATAFEKPLVIRHPQGHTVPRLSEQDTSIISKWTNEFCILPSISINSLKNDDNGSSEVQEKSIGIEKGEAESLEM
ncbi:esterase [Lithospermum erythrorhizon]|uniref:Esterase n=1 Tax=Lithospermum erythrorhizon TaxID=34254 RepID=A0AAV3PG27_LITER